MFALIELTSDMGARAILTAISWFFAGAVLLFFFDVTNKVAGYIYSAIWLIPPVLFGIFGATLFVLLGT